MVLSQPLARSAPLWAQGLGFDMTLGLSLWQAQIEVGVCFLWPQHSPTQNQGGVLVWAWVEIFVTGLRSSL